MNVSFIGYGNMAKAIIKGLAGKPDMSIRASSPSSIEGYTREGVYTHPNNQSIVDNADVVIMAVKPAQVIPILQTLQLPKDCLVISIAAAVPIKQLSVDVPNVAIMRAMPNTPIAAGEGATPMTANFSCAPRHVKAAERIFSESGIVEWVDESQLDALTPLSGSGPAYVYLFMEALAKAGEALGIKPSLSEKFTRQTIKGALALLEQEQEDPAVLRQKVTSPKGTTAAAIEIFEQEGFNTIIEKALQASLARAKAIKEELL